MTPVNPEMMMWIITSFNTVLQERIMAAGQKFPAPKRFYIEGDDLRDIKDDIERVELRLKGPDWLNNQGNNYDSIMEVNMFVSVVKGIPDRYRIHKIGGLCMNALREIPIKNYGSVPAGSETVQFCMIPNDGKPGRPGGSSPMKYHFFGQVEPKVNLLQAGCFARFYQTVPMN